MKYISSIISAALGIATLVLFLSVSVTIPMWGKVACFALCLANLITCLITGIRFNQDKTAFSPILSWIIQVLLTFGILAIVS